MVLLLALLASASAATLAVLPLGEGAGGDAWSGLGPALSGMVITDLSGVPGVRLVERDRIDAILSEISLGEKGFLDPTTAAKLGKGLGADLLVVGDYSVIGDRFVLDARLVDPATGEIRGAATADGTVDAFVDAEKALVKELLGRLDIALGQDELAAVAGQAPTRRLDALAAYGRGEALSREGKLDEARRAYESALAADPRFAMARAAALDLAGRLEAITAADVRAREDSKNRHITAVLDAVPDERTRPDDFRDKAVDIERFAVRLEALRRAHLDCERYAEMRHYLDRHGWLIAYPKGKYDDIWHGALDQAVQTGFVDADDASAQHDLSFALGVGVVPLFGSTASFLYSFPDPALPVAKSPDLMSAALACRGPVAVLDDIADIADQVAKHGVGAQLLRGSETFTLSERLEMTRMIRGARVMGLNDTDSARMLAIIDAHPDEETHYAAVSAGRSLSAAGAEHYRDRAAHLGFTEDELRGAVAALRDQDPRWLNVATPLCADLDGSLAVWGRTQVSSIARAADRDDPFPTPFIAPGVRAIADLGCLAGIPGRFVDPTSAGAWVATGPERLRVDADHDRCAEDLTAAPAHALDARATDATGRTAFDALQWYYTHLVLPGCVADPVVGSDDAAPTP